MSLDPTKRVPVPDNGAGMFDFGAGLGEVVQNILNGIGSILSGAITVGGIIFDAVVQGVTDFLEGIAQAIGGLLPSGSRFSPIQQAFQDGQLELKNRLDLLEGVQGYCAAFQGWNVNAEWGQGGYRWLPYDEQLGPAKNMHVDTYEGEIILHTPGMFVAYAKAHARSTSYGGNDYVYLDVIVMRPNGTEFTYTHVEKHVPRNHHQTIFVAWPFVVDFPGARVAVEAYSDNWRWWDGGTTRSTLHVIQHSNTSINRGSGTVPDERR